MSLGDIDNVMLPMAPVSTYLILILMCRLLVVSRTETPTAESALVSDAISRLTKKSFHDVMVVPVGLEPTTLGLEDRCSQGFRSTELRDHIIGYNHRSYLQGRFLQFPGSV